MNKTLSILALAAIAQPVFASAPLGNDLGFAVGRLLSVSVPVAMGTTMPGGIGGVAAIAAVSLVLGIQLIKRRKK